ncbi:MAG TPA: glycosyltransferase family 4 protein [Roseiflexaceae bacterium]|nr:glycosyltransferase family 4 protein [Roseiflexaceae bacterium]
MNILLPTDVFPPRCGGAGWSAHALASALMEHGHRVTALVPQPGARGVAREDVLGVPTVRYGYRVPPMPFVKNYARHEQMWPRLAQALVDMAGFNRHEPLVIHAQHVQTTPPAVLAGQRLGVPVVVTVRDHWPWDYFATGLHGDRVPYPRQSAVSLVTDFVARLGPVRGLAALPAIPYVLAHVRRRQHFLRQADAVIAVSRYIAEKLRTIVPSERVHVIPNMVDVEAIAYTVAEPPHGIAVDAPFLLFVGKLERNKGAHLLVDVFRALKDDGQSTEHRAQSVEYKHITSSCQLVVCGTGPLRPFLEQELTALGVQARFLDWTAHDDVLRLMARCELLLFPSAWGEPLSRVPLEASACGAPILAMPTGGTADIIIDGLNGALEPTPEGFARRLAALLAAPEQRQSLGMAARQAAFERFGAERVVPQVEALYQDVIQSVRH